MDKSEQRYLIGALAFMGLIALVVLLSSCQPTYSPPELTATANANPTQTPVVITVTPDNPPTLPPEITIIPTQEGPGWSIDCVPEEWQDQIINPNPCPINYAHHSWDGETVQEIPAGMGLYIRANADNILSVPDAPYENGATHLYTYGMVGEFGVSETVQMFAGHCYTFNVPVSIDFRDATHWENFAFYSKIHATDGNVYPLNEHPAIVVSGGTAALVASYPNRIFWGFAPNSNVTVEWEVGFRSVWATSAAGNFVDFEAFVIQDQFNTNLCN